MARADVNRAEEEEQEPEGATCAVLEGTEQQTEPQASSWHPHSVS